MRLAAFLDRIKSIGLPISDGYDAASYILGISYDDVKKVPLAEIPEKEAVEVLRLLESGTPEAYISRRREFYGHEFYVDENVLIPRVETEILVEEALSAADRFERPRVLDLCTGSGCILISVLLGVNGATGSGVDISAGALCVAEKNAKALGVFDRCELINADALSFKPKDGLFDILVCNPPYLTAEEYAEIDVRVKKEPTVAFIAEDKGLFFYKNILWNISLLCKKKSIVLFEIGYTQHEALSAFACELGVEVRFIKDISGINRVMVCEFYS